MYFQVHDFGESWTNVKWFLDVILWCTFSYIKITNKSILQTLRGNVCKFQFALLTLGWEQRSQKVNNRVNSRPPRLGSAAVGLRTHRLNGSQPIRRVKTHESGEPPSLPPFRVHESSSRPPFAHRSPSGYLPIGKVTFIWISLLRLRSAGSMGRWEFATGWRRMGPGTRGRDDARNGGPLTFTFERPGSRRRMATLANHGCDRIVANFWGNSWFNKFSWNRIIR